MSVVLSIPSTEYLTFRISISYNKKNFACIY